MKNFAIRLYAIRANTQMVILESCVLEYERWDIPWWDKPVNSFS